MVICLERSGADLHMAQLMPLPLTVSCFSEMQIGSTFLVPAHPGSPGQRAVKRLCVYVATSLVNKHEYICKIARLVVLLDRVDGVDMVPRIRFLEVYINSNFNTDTTAGPDSGTDAERMFVCTSTENRSSILLLVLGNLRDDFQSTDHHQCFIEHRQETRSFASY